MKLPRRPLTRVIALTTAVVTIGGAAAIADTSSVNVTLGTVNGERQLLVTGVEAGLPAGGPQLSFGNTGVRSPLGIVVTDVAYQRAGYSVSATLSDLYRLETSGLLDCTGQAVPSDAFDVTFGALPAVSGVSALVEPFLTYTDSDVNEDLSLLGISLTGVTGTLSVTVEDFAGFVQDLTTDLELMTVADGTGGTFLASAAHPACTGSGDASPTPVSLQTGTTNTPDLSGLTTQLFSTIDGSISGTDDSEVTAAETVTAGVLPTGADQQGGILWEATRDALVVVLDSAGLLLTTLQLDDLTDLVVDDLVAGSTDLLLGLVGQSGVYPNLPQLELDRAKVADAATGLYHGVMTITLTDDTRP